MIAHKEGINMFRLSLVLLIILCSDTAKGFEHNNGIYISDRDLKALALNIYWEARNQPVLGQVAVAWATKNRVKCNRFPSNYHDVVYQRTGKRRTSAFSWTPKSSGIAPSDTEAYSKAYAIAKMVAEGWSVDPTYGAVFYKADYSKALWKDKIEVSKIFTHVFYVKPGVCDEKFPKDG